MSATQEPASALRLDGLLNPCATSVECLKRHALLFDKFVTCTVDVPPGWIESAEIEFLRDRGLFADNWTTMPGVKPSRLVKGEVGQFRHYLHLESSIQEAKMKGWRSNPYPLEVPEDDDYLRYAAQHLTEQGREVVAVCERGLSRCVEAADSEPTYHPVLQVALKALPTPDDSHSWEEILEFRERLGDKRWAFRRFLRTLAAKRQTMPEIRDEIEWLVNEYRRGIEIHGMKAGATFVDVFLVSPMEIIEDIAKFRWSKVLKGAFSVRRRNAELLEAEMKAPGRECAYVFDSRATYRA